MLKSTLALKKLILNFGKDSDVTIESFITILNNCLEDVTKKIISNGTRLEKSNIHAVLLAAFFELNIYSLKNWNDYFLHFDEISAIIGIESNKNEGKILELLVMHTINNVFNLNSEGKKIKAYIANVDNNPSYLIDDNFKIDALSDEDNKRLINNLTVKMKIRGETAKEVWGDNDVVVCVEEDGKIQQFCIISCKVSLRERVYQSLFWSIHSRLEGTGKHVFVTIDKGNSGNTEIGSRIDGKNTRKTRNVLESSMDRVYVFRGEDEVSRSQVIKDFDFLKWDLDNWARDFTGKTNY